jgi:hypothetical protein
MTLTDAGIGHARDTGSVRGNPFASRQAYLRETNAQLVVCSS